MHTVKNNEKGEIINVKNEEGETIGTTIIYKGLHLDLNDGIYEKLITETNYKPEKPLVDGWEFLLKSLEKIEENVKKLNVCKISSIHTVKNEEGEIISKTFTLKNNVYPEDGLSFDNINGFYERLLTEVNLKPADIIITAKPLETTKPLETANPLEKEFITLKSSYQNGKSLYDNNKYGFKYNYFNFVKKKQYLGNYDEVNITIDFN